jgi:Transglutaminase-like superfamily
MSRLICKSYLLLLWTECFIKFGSLGALHAQVRRRRVEAPKLSLLHSTDELCLAMDLACVFYPKQVLCLQRAAATTQLLREHGIRAEMVIGAQLVPFQSHAWVEVDGIVVNDKPYIRDIYQELERC